MGELQSQRTKFEKECYVVATEEEREQYEDTPLRTSSVNLISINGFQEMIGLVGGNKPYIGDRSTDVHSVSHSASQRHPVVGVCQTTFPMCPSVGTFHWEYCIYTCTTVTVK
jgi:hypothetical protein